MTATLLYGSYRGDALNPQGSVIQRWLVDKGASSALTDADLPPIGSPLADYVNGSSLSLLTLRVAESISSSKTYVEAIYGPLSSGGFGPNPDEPDTGLVLPADSIRFTIVNIPVVRTQAIQAYSVGGVLFPLSQVFAELAVEKTVRQSVLRLEVTVSQWTFTERQAVTSKTGKLWTIGGDKYLLDGVDEYPLNDQAFKLTYSLTTEPPLLTSNQFYIDLNAGLGPGQGFVVPPSGLFPMQPFERLFVQMPPVSGGVAVGTPTFIKANQLEQGVGALTLPGIPMGYFP